MTPQWETQQLKIFFSDFPQLLTFKMCIQYTLIKLLVRREIQLQK